MTTKLLRADGSVLDARHVLQCKYVSSVNGDTDIKIGSACSDYIEVSLWGGTPVDTGEPLTYFRVAEDGTETKIGKFAAQKPTVVSDNVYQVLAYDCMASKLEASCVNWLSRSMFPQGSETYTLDEFAAAVCKACSVSYAGPGALLNSGFSVRPFGLERGTFRQLVGWIAQVGGCFAHMDAEGALRFGWYKDVSQAASPKEGAVPYLTKEGKAYQTAKEDAYYVRSRGAVLGILSQSRDDFTVAPIDALRVCRRDSEITAGSGTNVYLLEGNPILESSPQEQVQAAAEEILNRLSKIRYTPARVRLRDNALIRAGDLLRVYTRRGDAYTLAVMGLSVSGGGAMELTATGNPRRDSAAAIAAGSRNYTPAQQQRDTGRLIQEALVASEASIRGRNGGIRVDHTDEQGRVYETLYLDTMSEETARNVMRLNSQGIGFSTAGVNGEYTMALTVGGGLSNQWIRTWELVADVIQTGTLRGVEIIGEKGRIGGFEMSKNSLSASIRIDYPEFTQEDLDKMQAYYFGAGTLTEEEKEKYDVNMNGQIDSHDAGIIASMMTGRIPNYSVVHVSINSGNPRSVLTLEVTEGLFAGAKTTVGAGGVFTSRMVIAEGGFGVGETLGDTRTVTVGDQRLKFVGGIFAGVE